MLNEEYRRISRSETRRTKSEARNKSQIRRERMTERMRWPQKKRKGRKRNAVDRPARLPLLCFCVVSRPFSSRRSVSRRPGVAAAAGSPEGGTQGGSEDSPRLTRAGHLPEGRALRARKRRLSPTFRRPRRFRRSRSDAALPAIRHRATAKRRSASRGTRSRRPAPGTEGDSSLRSEPALSLRTGRRLAPSV
jgi:hypothetical protein